MDFARVHPLKNTATMDHVVMVHHNHPFPVRQLSLVSSHRLLEYFDMFHGKLLTGIFHSMADLYRKEMIFQFFFNLNEAGGYLLEKLGYLHCFGFSAGVMTITSSRHRSTFMFVLSSLHTCSICVRCSLVIARSLWNISRQACFVGSPEKGYN